MQTMSKKKYEKSENSRFYEQNKFLFEHPAYCPWIVLAIWLYVRDPEKI
jgi:hypothetical protein